MPCSSRQICRILLILTASFLATNCSPIYTIGVRGLLAEPMSVDCVLHAAQTTEGVQHVLIHQSEPKTESKLIQTIDNFIDPPTVYLVTTVDQDAQIEQGLLKDGKASFWVGKKGVGVKPSLRTIDAIQTFHVRVASHIADVCQAHYSGNTRLTCIPDSEACQTLLASPRSK
jgi:hypothetical protein